MRVCNNNSYIKDEREEEMKGNETNFGKACLNGCKRVLAQIRNAREVILVEARKTIRAQEQLLRLALNEAEALAWQTLYPQLVFPDLAMENIRGVAAWNDRQKAVIR
jgi:hypothetical protein